LNRMKRREIFLSPWYRRCICILISRHKVQSCFDIQHSNTRSHPANARNVWSGKHLSSVATSNRSNFTRHSKCTQFLRQHTSIRKQFRSPIVILWCSIPTSNVWNWIVTNVFLQAVEFLGHRVDAQRVHKSADKHIKAIRDAPKPSTAEELQLFLEKATYYRSFIPDLFSRNCPLWDILHTKPLQWTKAAEEAYLNIRNALTSPLVLMPYDPQLQLILATGASKTDLGAVLSHELSNGMEWFIAYISRSITPRNSAIQIDKEALAIMWAMKKFFHYIYARHFTLITNYKTLTRILYPEKSLPVLCMRMANYADYLSHFNFDIVFKPTKSNINADCSWMPLPSTVNTTNQQKRKRNKYYNAKDSITSYYSKSSNYRYEQKTLHESRKDSHLKKIIYNIFWKQASVSLASDIKRRK